MHNLQSSKYVSSRYIKWINVKDPFVNLWIITNSRPYLISIADARRLYSILYNRYRNVRRSLLFVAELIYSTLPFTITNANDNHHHGQCAPMKETQFTRCYKTLFAQMYCIYLCEYSYDLPVLQSVSIPPLRWHFYAVQVSAKEGRGEYVAALKLLRNLETTSTGHFGGQPGSTYFPFPTILPFRIQPPLFPDISSMLAYIISLAFPANRRWYSPCFV